MPKRSIMSRKKKCLKAAKASGLIDNPEAACKAAFAGSDKNRKLRLEKTKIKFP